MSKRNAPAKPCRIRVTRHYNDSRELFCDRVYRSVRQARDCIYDATEFMDRFSRATYSIDIVTLGGEVKPVSEATVDRVESYNQWESWHNSIGSRMARGETVIV